MAQTATRPGSGTARRAHSRPVKPEIRARATTRRAARTVKPHRAPCVSLARVAARKAVKLIARKALRGGARAIRAAADRTADAGRAALEATLERRPPIQVSIDVAVPLSVVWQEWTQLAWLTEGIHRIEQVERDGTSLFGRTTGARSREWMAEIIDERPQESFAWRSEEGSDCAGLVTFHRLVDRLTRIELDIDVLPTGPGEALTLSLHRARRRAEADLRRFKAHVEFISPDVYPAAVEPNGAGPAGEPYESEDEPDH
jgi:uncharacterized membrane protein